jgi:pyruvate dehydrogenase (quinone)
MASPRGKGIRLEDPGEVEGGIASALAHNWPVLVDAVAKRAELAMPPAVSLDMAKDFTLYIIKAVMSGRGDKLLDLARTNVWAERGRL